MCTIVGLYLIFKQRRPCFDCEKGCPIGTLYGMPSGDALYGAVIGCYASKKNLLIGIITMLSVCFSRVSKGYHSVLQTIVGASIGISIYFIQIYAGYKFEIFNWLIALFLPLQALFDKNLKIATPKKFDNLHAWLFFDISTLLFDFLLCPPEAYNLFANVPITIPASIYYFTVFLSSTFALYTIEKGISLSLV
ncbi:hypothetical protein TVAG_163500 [Trichomonas vaginalis G3]|uniref:PAP2 superfamily protein n=1 Tax=Trichomonas vaginalis (strain ATCC PRA-98 / G3) TaxID=412133 RepID=A2DG27_TRIV3|nr:PAP2 superfamily [Trichomonas vaginalis G3]EAY20654.1 hypothetical protein TVAG_163500 [Trichomonas vaginalis G3]KAI5487375.1 PAP2 superfamily [Trichomonas vaginalis G3]|eukprot:XP_001581640.1 hypothetical protein [Trichomonas vaginalis G3]